MVINSSRQTPSDLRRRHRAIALADVQANPGISRSELARKLGLSDMAATRIVRELIQTKVVREMPGVDETSAREGRSVGRPKIGLIMRKGAIFGAGMTFSAYHAEVSISDGNGEIIGRRNVKNAPFSDPLECARLFSNELDRLIEHLGIPRQRICGVGVVLSAKVDPESGAIIHSDYFGWGDDEGAFSDCVREILGLPVSIRNIADAIAVAEMQYGIARHVQNFVLIHTATLTGASIVTNGEVLLGHDGFAGRVGHIAHEERGFSCVCGRRDCLNLSASGFAILKDLGLNQDSGFLASHIDNYAEQLMQAVNQGCDDALQRAGQSIAPLLDMLTATLNPEVLILSGFVGAQECYRQGAIHACRAFRPKDFSSAPEIVGGTISAVQAAPMLAVSELLLSDLFDLEGYLNTAHLVEEQAA